VYHCGEDYASIITGTFTEYIVADTLFFFTCAKTFNEKLWHLKINRWTERRRGREGVRLCCIAICKLNFMIFKAF